MVKRTIKRRIKKIIVSLFIIIPSIVALIIVFLIAKNFIPIFRALNTGNNRNIIKPIGNLILKPDIEKKLSEKNIIMESLEEATTSALITGKIKNGPEVLFSTVKDLDWQINSLQLILTRLAIENKKPILLDLRYDQPIVKF